MLGDRQALSQKIASLLHVVRDRGWTERATDFPVSHIVIGNSAIIVEHDGKIEGEYDTKESAFESILGPASTAIKLGYEVSITIARPTSPRSAPAEQLQRCLSPRAAATQREASKTSGIRH